MISNWQLNEVEDHLSVGDVLLICFFTFLLTSGFSISIFSFNKVYLFEVPVFCVTLYSLLFPNKVSSFFTDSIRSNHVHVVLSIIYVAIFFIIGLINTFEFSAVYSDFRANCVAVIGFFYIKYLLENNKFQFLYAITTAVGVIFVLHWLYLYIAGGLDVKYPSPILAMVISSFLAFRLNSTPKLLFSLGVLAFLAVVSFFRQYWLYVVATFFIIATSTVSVRAKLKIFLALLFFLIVYFFGYGLIDKFFNSNESFYIQSIGKTNDMLELIYGTAGLTESDAIRVGYFEYLFNNFIYLIFPHGLGSRYYFDNIDPWFFQYAIEANTIDSLAFYIIFHYGYITIFLLLWFIFKVMAQARNVGVIKPLCFFFPLFLVLLFDGGAATVIPRAFWVGGYFSFFIYEMQYSFFAKK